ncbi:hemagglutinin repeat-containing protein [Halomonas sp. ML-15]|uniref:hemagglutinin repeat-containing protein n=1 Tax=Halomonas sp. ML-15 TaxID=2773305 RepID=UPI0017477A12|nr:hemagglutinin repeat-containing protein [Halomonas sp. ML-15]MBD3898322.1 hemagglutinin repeat-containing protein [Halomonas sp. ML-15]
MDDILNTDTLAGRIGGNRVDLDARNDLDNIGGEITAGESLNIAAGRDLNLASTSERLAGLYVTEAGGSLNATAGRDLSVVGADLDSAGDLRLGAGRDLDIASTSRRETRWGGMSERSELERGASLSAGDDLILDAGRDLSLATLTTQERFRTRHNTRRESEEIGTQLEAVGVDADALAGVVALRRRCGQL